MIEEHLERIKKITEVKLHRIGDGDVKRSGFIDLIEMNANDARMNLHWKDQGQTSEIHGYRAQLENIAANAIAALVESDSEAETCNPSVKDRILCG